MVFKKTKKHALGLLPSRAASAWLFSHSIHALRLTFCLQPQKVSKKCRSPNYVLHPIIFDI
jgi:hypothetical protein